MRWAFALPLRNYLQTPWKHVPPLPQAVPSLRTLLLHLPVTWSQLSPVQVLPSSQFLPCPKHLPLVHWSLVVHASLSSQACPPGLATWVHRPLVGSQPSAVQTLPSPQSRGAPALQTPLLQASLTVHRLPSSQGPDSTTVNAQLPLLGSQPSVVQGLPSLHALSKPPVQVPFWHCSPVVQASPSSHLLPLAGVCAQPLTGSHESVVHALPSSQALTLPPTHRPPEHKSPVVQVLPSLHDAVLSTLW